MFLCDYEGPSISFVLGALQLRDHIKLITVCTLLQELKTLVELNRKWTSRLFIEIVINIFSHKASQPKVKHLKNSQKNRDKLFKSSDTDEFCRDFIFCQISIISIKVNRVSTKSVIDDYVD